VAYTERYVTSAAGGGGDGSVGTPWTLAEAFANAAAGDRVNIQSDSGYSIGVTAVANAGTDNDPICYRGYNSAIGDLDEQSRSTGGFLDTTNFPDITLTGSLNFPNAAYSILQNLDFTANFSGHMVGGTTADNFVFLNCRLVHTLSHVNAKCVDMDNHISLIGCHIKCSGANHGSVVDIDLYSYIDDCILEGLANVALAYISHGTVLNSVFIGNNTGDGVTATVAGRLAIKGNTFYNLSIAIRSTPVSVIFPIIKDNHVTDCSTYLYNNNFAADEVAMVEINNRLRDNTTPRTGIYQGINIGAEITDTGGPETDFEDVGNDDFRLIDSAPAIAVALIPFRDIGALQKESAGGSTVVLHGSTNGGFQ
jgi:hypothetical protein